MNVRESFDLKPFIRDVVDFPKPGILFKDITPLLAHPQAFQNVIDRLADAFRDRGVETIAAAEARGFLFGTPLAMALGVGFVPIRKPGKLPYATISQEYQLEYGTDRLHVHSDALTPGRRVRSAARVMRCSATNAPFVTTGSLRGRSSGASSASWRHERLVARQSFRF